MLTTLKRIFNNKARQSLNGRADVQSLSVRAKVTRADGTVEPERLVSYGHRNPFIHILLAPFAFANGAFWNWYYTHKRRS